MRSAHLGVVMLALLAAPPLRADVSEPGRGLPADCPLTVVRAYYSERSTADRLSLWTEPWEVHHDLGYLVVGVDADGFARLVADGFQVEVDERLTRTYCTPPQRLEGQRSGIPGYPCYRTVEETYAAAQALATAYPQLASVVDIGDSWEKTNPGGLDGYDLLVLKLTNSAVAGTPTGTEPPHGKPRFLVTAAIHAREYATAELAIRFAEQLLSTYGVDPDATWLLDEHELHILLHTNPDGRKHAEAGEEPPWYGWRKNTNENYCGATDPNRGADLNRNFSYQWGCCGGSSGDQCDETYRGPAAATEPEVQAVQTYARSIFPDQRGPNLTDPASATATGVYFDLHSYGDQVLWPWGFTSTAPPNGPAMQTLGRRLAYFNGYEPSQAIGLYPIDGSTVDFSYGDLGVPGYVFEVGTTFFQDCGTFASAILPDNLAALEYALKVARTPYLTPSGPSVTSVESPDGTLVGPGDPVEAQAVVDDLPFSAMGGTEPTQNISAAEVYLDAPPWQQPPPTPLAMAALDGSFNSKTETVVATVSTVGLADGRHVLYFRGQDTSPQWGAVSAAFFWVLDPATAPHLQGTVRDASTNAPLAATVTAGPFSTATNPANGSYAMPLPAGTYDVTATADGYGSATANGVVLTTGVTTTRSFLLAPYGVVFADDVESGNIGWTAQSPWAITTEASSSPTHSWTDSPGGQYGDDRNVSLTSPVLDLTGISSVKLELDHIYDLEDTWDFGFVEVSTDDSTWTTVASYTGTHTSSWEHVAVDVPELAGSSTARFRFRLDSDGFVGADGWHVDDVVLKGAVAVPEGLLFRDGFESGATSAWSVAVP